MTPLSLFFSGNTGGIANLARVGGGVFDCNINGGANYIDDEYAVAGGMKKIHMREGIPYFETRDPGHALVRAHALHFQGSAKGHMALYYTGRCFNGKMLTDFKSFIYRCRRSFRRLQG